MKLVFALVFFFSIKTFASDTTRLLYNPYAHAEKDVEALLVKAKQEKKHVLLQIGGNWCVMCYRLNSIMQTDTLLKPLISDNYLVYHLNYSRENKNLAYLKKLGNPQHFGFPVLVVLDGNGNRLHTQDCSLLLKGNGYHTGKVKSFLMEWSPDRYYLRLGK